LLDGIINGGGMIACVAILANKTPQEVVDKIAAVDHGGTAELHVLEELLIWHEGA
jgi:hypothetical protein